MTELKTDPRSPLPASFTPSLDVHEQDGELVLHAHLRGFEHEDVLISLEGSELVFTAAGATDGAAATGQDSLACYGRLPLPFAPQALRTVSRPGHEDLEVRVSLAGGHE